MTFLGHLTPPDWHSLPGGDGDTEAWLTARTLKLQLAIERAPRIIEAARALDASGALFCCSPEILLSIPYAARFYIDLLALTRKTLNRIVELLAAYEMTVTPETIARNLLEGRSVSESNLDAFVHFINDQISAVFPAEARTFEAAIGTVLVMEGARIQGVVQNIAGSAAVTLVKSLLVAGLEARRHACELFINDEWIDANAGGEQADATRIRFDRRLECEFIPGGNRPDIRVSLNGVVVAVGEIKGRKDLSNLWESWLPQISGHLRTWTAEFPDAPRLFFGTIVTDEMIEGVTQAGTHHAGLKVLHRNGLLTAAYNLSLLASGDAKATRSFDELLDRLSSVLRH